MGRKEYGTRYAVGGTRYLVCHWSPYEGQNLVSCLLTLFILPPRFIAFSDESPISMQQQNCSNVSHAVSQELTESCSTSENHGRLIR